MGSCYVKDVLKVAQDYIGYTEGPNNWTIFAECLDAVHYFNTAKQHVEWCSTFLNFCILKACIPEDRSDEEKKWDALYFSYEPTRDNCACGVKYWAGYFRNNNAWDRDPDEGAIAFYGSKYNEYHVGIVEKVESDGSFWAIEGNHGNQVARVHRVMSEVAGFGHPRYDGYSPEPTPPGPEPKEKYAGPWVDFPLPDGRNYIQRYDTGEQVKRLQNFLVWMLGPDCLPKYGIDSECGPETMSAVREAQSLLGVTVDGFYGVKTQAAAKNYEK